jgi:hypothetical protein
MSQVIEQYFLQDGENFSELELLALLSKLPDSLKLEILHYTEFLVNKCSENDSTKKRKAGLLKGKIWMSDDFDDPLEEFEEYM